MKLVAVNILLPLPSFSPLPSPLPSPPSDLNEGRLQVAKTMGATHTLRVTARDSRALARQIVDILGSPPDQSIECSGAEPSIATAIYVSE